MERTGCSSSLTMKASASTPGANLYLHGTHGVDADRGISRSCCPERSSAFPAPPFPCRPTVSSESIRHRRTSSTAIRCQILPQPGTVNNFLYNGPLINTIDQGDIRVDYRTANSSLFGRFSREDPSTYNPGFLPSPAIGGGPGYPGVTLAPGTQVVIGYGRSIGPSKYYELRTGYSRLVEDIIVAGTEFGNVAKDLAFRTRTSADRA